MQTTANIITPAKRRIHKPRPVPNIDSLPASALLTRQQLIAVSGFSLATLRRWATEERGPRVTMVEGRPRYRAEHVRDWLAGR